MSEKKKIATREGFGKEIVALGKENPDILVAQAWLRVLPPAARSPSWSPTPCSAPCVCAK